MFSAPIGTRIVARALPGGAGPAARASAACFAAWRAAHGAAPRRPSLRFAGTATSALGSSLMRGTPGFTIAGFDATPPGRTLFAEFTFAFTGGFLVAIAFFLDFCLA